MYLRNYIDQETSDLDLSSLLNMLQTSSDTIVIFERTALATGDTAVGGEAIFDVAVSRTTLVSISFSSTICLSLLLQSSSSLLSSDDALCIVDGQWLSFSCAGAACVQERDQNKLSKWREIQNIQGCVS